MLDCNQIPLKNILTPHICKRLRTMAYQVLIINILNIQWGYAQSSILESVEPTYVYIPQCCVNGEYNSASAAFSAAKAVWDQNTTQGSITITRTAKNLQPFSSSSYPIYNGNPALYVSGYTSCYKDQCTEHTTGGPSVRMVMRCPEDVVKVGKSEYRFGLFIEGSGGAVSRKAYCKRNIHIISRTNQCVGNPILPATGEKIQIETDYKSADGILEFTRTYRSIKGLTTSLATKKLLDLYSPSFVSTGCLNSWHTENNSLKKRIPVCFKYFYPPAQTSTYRILLESGDILTFSGVGGQLNLNHGINYSLKIYSNDQNKTEYELKTATNHRDYFDNQGNLIRTVNPSGKIRIYNYSTDDTPIAIAPRPGLLISQQDQYGNQLQFFYNENEQLIKMKDPADKEYLYEYDNYNNVTAVIYPGGARRQYSYGELGNINEGAACSGSNDKYARLLTGITDERNIRFADFKYNCDAKAISSEHAGGVDKFSITYNLDGSSAVINELGKTTIYRYTSIAGALLVSKVEGQPTSNCAGANRGYTYTPEGWLASKTDWMGVKTTYTYNSLGQETSRIEALGTPEAKTIITEWHPTLYVKTKEIEPGRETLYNYDANGNLLSRTVNSLTIP